MSTTPFVREELLPQQFENSDVKNVTGTVVGSKMAMDVNLLGGSVGSSVVIDLGDKINTFDLYQLNDFTDAATSYFGLSDKDGTWLVKRLIDASGTMRYANESNNPTVTDYSTAWTNRATLNYDLFGDLTNY